MGPIFSDCPQIVVCARKHFEVQNTNEIANIKINEREFMAGCYYFVNGFENSEELIL